MNPYTENYYRSGNYLNYLNKSEKYVKLSEDIYDLFKKICILNNNHKYSWLDYGSGPGLFAKALRNLPCSLEVSVFDISQWSLSQLQKENFKICDISKKCQFNIASFLDVLEHMADDEIINVFKNVFSEYLIIRIPVASNDSFIKNKFHLEISNLDNTHINCKTKSMWQKFFSNMGYELLFNLNLSNIYDSDGVFCAVFKNTIKS